MIAIVLYTMLHTFQGSICFDNMLDALVYKEMSINVYFIYKIHFLPCIIGDCSNRWIIWMISITLLELFYIKEYMEYYAYQDLVLCVHLLFFFGFCLWQYVKGSKRICCHIHHQKRQKRRHFPFAFFHRFCTNCTSIHVLSTFNMFINIHLYKNKILPHAIK